MKPYTLYIAELENVPDATPCEDLALLYRQNSNVSMFRTEATNMEEASDRLLSQAFLKGWSTHNTTWSLVDEDQHTQRQLDEARTQLAQAKARVSRLEFALKNKQPGGNP